MKYEFREEKPPVKFTKQQKKLMKKFIISFVEGVSEICKEKINPFIKKRYHYYEVHGLYIGGSHVSYNWDMLDYCDFRNANLANEYDYVGTEGPSLGFTFFFQDKKERHLKIPIVATVFLCKVEILLYYKNLEYSFTVDFRDEHKLEEVFEKELQNIFEFISDSVDNIIYDINNNWKIEE
jgi:hypothetical protein